MACASTVVRIYTRRVKKNGRMVTDRNIGLKSTQIFFKLGVWPILGGADLIRLSQDLHNQTLSMLNFSFILESSFVLFGAIQQNNYDT